MRDHSTAGFRAYAVQDVAHHYSKLIEAYRERDRKAFKNELVAIDDRLHLMRDIIFEMSARADDQRYWLRTIIELKWRKNVLRRRKLTDHQALTLLAFVITEHLP